MPNDLDSPIPFTLSRLASEPVEALPIAHGVTLRADVAPLSPRRIPDAPGYTPDPRPTIELPTTQTRRVP